MVSVIVPIYNVEKYLEDCINSILDQTYENIEILLVNDGSSDSSLDICQHYANKSSKITIYNKKNGGLSDARNFGLDRIKGDFVCFVDGDDCLEKDCLERALEKFTENIDIVVFGWHIKKENTIRKGNYKYTEGLKSRVEGLQSLLDLKGCQSFAWNKLYRKELWEGIRYPLHKYYEDIYTTFKIFEKARYIYFLDNPLYLYIQRSNSISNAVSLEKAQDFYEGKLLRKDVLSPLYPELKSALDRDIMQTVIDNCFRFVPQNKIEKIIAKQWERKLKEYFWDILKTKNLKQLIKYLISMTKLYARKESKKG